MKVGILTIHAPLNYGAALQSYALRRLITILFPQAQVDVLNYAVSNWERRTHPGKLARGRAQQLRQHTFGINDLLHYRQRLRRFRTFRNEHLTSDPELTSLHDLASRARRYDSIVVGSDQVWNPSVTFGRFEDAFFWYGMPKPFGRLIAYGASWGGGQPELQGIDGDLLVGRLGAFDSLSTRESSSAAYLSQRNLRGLPCMAVLDPVEFSRVALPTQSVFRPGYILDYRIQNSYTSASAFEVGRVLGRDTLSIEAFQRASWNGHRHRMLGVEEFVGAVDGAHGVVTNSLHGTLLAIKARKQFVCVGLTAGVAPRARRLTDCLDRIGLLGRFIPEFDLDRVVELLRAPVRWNSVIEQYDSLEAESTRYLKSALLW